MRINTKNALNLWEQTFGDEQYATDFSGALIRKDHYNDRTKTTPFTFKTKNKTYTVNHCTAWNIHHKRPLSKGGTNEVDNLEIINMEVHDRIENKTSFSINERSYHVVREKGNRKSYSISPTKIPLQNG